MVDLDQKIKQSIRIIKSLYDPQKPYICAFYWWISELSIKNHERLQLFEIDYEEEIKRILYNYKKYKS